MVANYHQRLDTSSVDYERPPATLLKAWQCLKSEELFITPTQIAQAAQIGHDVAEDYLQNWFNHGILERTPRYPRYVYRRARNWHSRWVAQKLNQLTQD